MRTLSKLVLTSMALLGTAAAHAAPYGIATDNGMTWEQVRFYGPAGGSNSDYASGQPIYYGTVPTDRCAGNDICGEAMTFDTKFGGLLTVTAPDTVTNKQSIVYQDLDPAYGGLGVMQYSTPTQQNPSGLSGLDEINEGELLTLTFANTVKIVGFHFFDEDHQQDELATSTWWTTTVDKFGLKIDGGSTNYLPFKTGSDRLGYPWYGESSTLIGNTFTFSYKHDDYYLGAIKIQAVTPPIPEPETYALMLGGLLAMGFMARRRGRN